MRRNEDRYGVLKPEAFTQLDPETGQPVAHFVAWQIVQGRYVKMHGRLYGNSLLESARKVYKQIQLIEDGMVIGRLYRSHLRYIFQIPVDGMSAEAAEAYLMKKKLEIRKKNRFNPANEKLEQFDSPIGADEDFFMGVRKEGVQGKVETIQGQGSLSDIGDVEFFHTNYSGVTKETRIPCLDGKIRTLDSLISDFREAGQLPWVYSYDVLKRRIVPGKVTWAGITHKTGPIITIKLDDGTLYNCAPGQPWVLLDGTVVSAEDLRRGEQLVPLRRSIRKSNSYIDYEAVNDPFGGSDFTHIRVAREIYPEMADEPQSVHVHHKNKNKLDNSPNNLELLSPAAHMAVHRPDFKAERRHGQRVKRLCCFCKKPFRTTTVAKHTFCSRRCSNTFRNLKKRPWIKRRCVYCGILFRTQSKRSLYCSKPCWYQIEKRKHPYQPKIPKVMKRHCAVCSKEFQFLSSLPRKPNVCSSACRQVAWRAKKRLERGVEKYAGRERRKTPISIQCIYCGNECERRWKKIGKFCSAACSQRHRRKLAKSFLPVPNHIVASVLTTGWRLRELCNISVEERRNVFIADATTGGVLIQCAKRR